MAESTSDVARSSADGRVQAASKGTSNEETRGVPGAELSVEEIKRVELETLLAFDPFARAHGLAYWLFYGTLLGAARHQGFIPWDDDIDIAMPKDDYYRLVDLVNGGASLGEHWSFNAPSVDGAVCPRPFGKVFDTRTVVEQHELYPIPGLHEGVWIDVFPLVGFDDPTGSLPDFIQRFDLNFGMLRRAAFKFTKGSNLAGTVRRLMAWAPARIAGYRRWLDACEAIQKGAPDLYEGAWCTATAETEYVFPTALFDRSNDRRLPFEGCEFPVPERWEEILELRYGDWRSLPPEDQRESAHDFVARWAD